MASDSSYDIAAWQVEQYSSNVLMLAQQKKSKLRRTVYTDGTVVGRSVYFDALGQSEAQRNLPRNSDTILANPDHQRRKAEMVDYDWAKLMDPHDDVRTIADATSKYSMGGAAALGRGIDDEIITALGASAASGQAGASSTALPAAQKIVHGSVGLTYDKVVEAVEILNLADVDEDEEKFAVVAPKQISNLLKTIEATSSDYSTVMAIQAGSFQGTWMGFRWIMSNRLALSGTARLCYCYTSQAIGFGPTAQELTVDIGPRRDKRMATQVYVRGSFGAVRRDDKRVVQIACTES